jgi:hypothetical protein
MNKEKRIVMMALKTSGGHIAPCFVQTGEFLLRMNGWQDNKNVPFRGKNPIRRLRNVLNENHFSTREEEK